MTDKKLLSGLIALIDFDCIYINPLQRNANSKFVQETDFDGCKVIMQCRKDI
jgi:hypothetical protein